MYVNFGAPISAREYFGLKLDRFTHAQLPIHVQHLSKTELALVTDFGHYVSLLDALTCSCNNIKCYFF